MLSRRRFLGLAGGAAVGAAAAARLTWSGLVEDHVPDGATAAGAGGAAGDRVLVVVQLGGGNDGLNTVIPRQDGRYADARPTLRVAEADVVALAGQSRYGLHPSLRDLVPLWESDRLAAVESIGFPDQSRSHFAAMDTWWRASTDRQVRTGWLGRWLDRSGDATNPLRAIALGGGSPALVGDRSLATVVLDPAQFSLRTPKGADRAAITDAFLATAAPLDPDPTRAAAQQAIPASVTAVEALARAASGAGAPDEGADAGGPEGRIASLLGTAAGIIDLDLGTRLILVAADGFDTHTDQQDRHGPLLADLAAGLRRFFDALAARGRLDRVTVITTSEFGRRVHENGTGTDHGTGSVQFVAGAGVARAQVVGDADLGDLADGDLRAAIDTRTLYAAALDWLGGDAGATDEILGGAFDRHGLVRA
jgi:uncharacterized protein (DUF1501 family)